LRPGTLTPEAQKEIAPYLQDCAISLDNLNPLFSSLRWIVGYFKAGCEIAEESKPAAIRKNLRDARKRAQKLNEVLRNLSLACDREICYAEVPASYQYERYAADLERWLRKACEKADTYPRTGRLPEPVKVTLAGNVAKAIHYNLGIEPRGTRESRTPNRKSLYFFLVSVVYQAATG
jgi:hypothetical protein